jgi:Fe-S-cluster-containing dehydrogenase component
MSINRRNFFKAMGATAVALSVGLPSKASGSNTAEQSELYGMLYDMSRCRGCHGCEYDCAWAHEMPEPDIPKNPPHRDLDQNCRTVVNNFETSKGTVAAKRQCMHCNQPACDTACLTQAMQKTIEGPVIWREDKCMGCRYCMVSCPFDIPKFEYNSTNPKVIKCDMCHNLLKEGEIPSCAYNCPEEALLYGKRSDLIKEARKRIHDDPDTYIDYIYGEHEAGGTSWLYISPVPFEEVGLNMNIQKKSYPGLTKGFISSIAPVDLLLPTFLLGVYQATKPSKIDHEEETI